MSLYAPESYEARPTTARENAPQQILYIDDDADLREFSCRLLRGSGYQVESAKDGEEGWEAIQKTRFHLVITDHDMPRLTGLELTDRVRSAGIATPVILASGSMPFEDMEIQLVHQVTATLAKPFTFQELLATVRGILRPVDEEIESAGPDFRR